MTSFVRGTPPPKKNPVSASATVNFACKPGLSFHPLARVTLQERYPNSLKTGPKLYTYVQDWMQVLFTYYLTYGSVFLTFSYYFICVLVSFYEWGHFVMHFIRNLNLTSVQSWTYLKWQAQVVSLQTFWQFNWRQPTTSFWSLSITLTPTNPVFLQHKI